MPLLQSSDTRLHVLGHATVAIERAARRGATMMVDIEARRLLADYPNCSMSFPELRDRIVILAARRGVTVADEKLVSEVGNILDMWSFIESGYLELSQEQKRRVEKEAASFGERVFFSGFDGDNEAEYIGAARLLIERMQRFPEFKGRDLNSHLPSSLEGYRRMYALFEPMRARFAGGGLLASQIIRLLQERRHPARRKWAKPITSS